MHRFTTILIVLSSLTTASTQGQQKVESALKDIVKQTMSVIDHGGDGSVRRIALLKFENSAGGDSCPSPLANYLYELLEVQLVNRGKDRGLEVVERTVLEALLKEQDLALSDLVSQDRDVMIGRIAKATAILTGRFQPFSDHVLLNVRLIDIATSRLMMAQSYEIRRTERINELLVADPCHDQRSQDHDRKTAGPGLDRDRTAKKDSRSFFERGVSAFYLFGGPTDNLTGTFDMLIGYRAVQISVGYSKYLEHEKEHYGVAGVGVAFHRYAHVQYLMGFPVISANTINKDFDNGSRIAHHVIFTPLRSRHVDLGVDVSWVHNKTFWGAGLRIH